MSVVDDVEQLAATIAHPAILSVARAERIFPYTFLSATCRAFELCSPHRHHSDPLVFAIEARGLSGSVRVGFFARFELDDVFHARRVRRKFFCVNGVKRVYKR